MSSVSEEPTPPTPAAAAPRPGQRVPFQTGRRGTLTKPQVGWAMFEAGAQPLRSVFLPYVLAPFFVGVLAPDTGPIAWGVALGLGGLSVALFAVLLGPVADGIGRHKPWILGFSALAVVGAASVAGADPTAGVAAVALVLIAQVLIVVGLETATPFVNALMPGLARDDVDLGRLSGSAYALGYVAMVAALGLVLGVSVVSDDLSSATAALWLGPVAALWLVACLVPLARLTPDRPPKDCGLFAGGAQGWSRAAHALSRAAHYKNPFRFLIARMVYNDGAVALAAFVGIAGVATFGWGAAQLGVIGITVAACAVAGALAGGYADIRHRAKNVILCGLGVGCVAGLILASSGPGTVLWLPISTESSGYHAMMSTPGEQFFQFGAMLFGFALGMLQTASRTMLARLCPHEMEATFFGLYALSGKATAWVVPPVVGLVSVWLDPGTALLVPVAAMLLGGVILLPVEPDRAIAPEHLPLDDGTSLMHPPENTG